jgi:DNA-binding transcriptional ArsR family regulator
MPTAVLPDEALEALGNAERRRIVVLLAEKPHSVGALAAHFTISRPAISRHLKILGKAGLIRLQAAGTRNLYRLDHRGFEATAGWLESFWNEAETRLRLLAENTNERDGGRE